MVKYEKLIEGEKLKIYESGTQCVLSLRSELQSNKGETAALMVHELSNNTIQVSLCDQ